MPHGCAVGGSLNATPRSRMATYVAWASVVRKTIGENSPTFSAAQPPKPLASTISVVPPGGTTVFWRWVGLNHFAMHNAIEARAGYVPSSQFGRVRTRTTGRRLPLEAYMLLQNGATNALITMYMLQATNSSRTFACWSCFMPCVLFFPPAGRKNNTLTIKYHTG